MLGQTTLYMIQTGPKGLCTPIKLSFQESADQKAPDSGPQQLFQPWLPILGKSLTVDRVSKKHLYRQN